MPQRSDNLIVVLDVGSAWTRVLAADVNEGAARYRGHGIVESAGMRKGLIGELGPASRAVRSACEAAERVARLNIVEGAVGVGDDPAGDRDDDAVRIGRDGDRVVGAGLEHGLGLHDRLR